MTPRSPPRRYAGRAGVNSYGELVQSHFGRLGSTLLQSAIVVHVSGVMIGYNGKGLQHAGHQAGTQAAHAAGCPASLECLRCRVALARGCTLLVVHRGAVLKRPLSNCCSRAPILSAWPCSHHR